MGEAGSVFRAFVDETLKNVFAHSNFLDRYAEEEYVRQRGLLRSPALFSQPDPWIIPSGEEVAELEKDMFFTPYVWSRTDHFRNPEPGEEDFWERVKYRYSAAAAAVSFLKSTSTQARIRLRRVLIDKDHEAVASPECHALGLIPYCLENPHLRIERRLSI